MKSVPCPIWLPFAAALVLLTLTGCKRDEVKVYQADANEAAASATPSAAMPMTMPPGLPAPDNQGRPQLKFILPAGWKENPASQFRVASFSVSENGQQADVSVIPMDGMAGGNLANVNRWRGQIGLEQIEESALPALTEKAEIAGQAAELFDLAGTGGAAQRIIASVLHRENTAWFFKITGASELVEKNKAAFIAFLKSVEFGGSPALPMNMSQLPPSHPAISEKNVAVPPSDKPSWTVPAGWSDAPLTQFLIAKFSIAAADGEAAVNVSSLTGQGGGLAANVNRWRGQLGLPPISEIISTEIEVPGGKATVVDYSGTDAKTGKPARLLGVMVPQSGATWFYKLMGDEKIVAAQKEAFVKFIQSAKYPDAH